MIFLKIGYLCGLQHQQIQIYLIQNSMSNSQVIIGVQKENDKTQSQSTINIGDLNAKQVYPVLDICFTSRAHGSVINQMKQPLLKYKKQIYSTQSQYHNQKLPDYNDFQTIGKKDGMIHFYRDMYMDRTNQNRSYENSKGKKHFYGPKVLIVICMYNQGIQAINLTLKGIYNNLKQLKKKNIAPEDVAVILIQDGILKLVEDRNRRTYAKKNLSIVQFVKLLDKHDQKQYCQLQARLHTILDSIDQFKRKQQQNLIKNNNDFPPNIQKQLAILYQNQWKPQYTQTKKHGQHHQDIELKQRGNIKMQDSSSEFDNARQQQIKLNIFTCFKNLNGKKLHSHLWFFEGFCRYLQPEFVVLLDVGTTPGYKSQLEGKNDYYGLTKLIQGFYADKNIGGVTGLMSIDSDFPSLEGESEKKQDKNHFKEAFFCIQKAQQYEYIMAHFLDKNFQSSTGFLHVLPGAWSAYRYVALIKSQKYEQNLLQRSYFTPILNPEMQQKSSYQQQNMYLAQDRILSLGIYCQAKSQYTLSYIPDGVAFTDPMKDHKTLLGQRRRWINSSLFAFLYVWRNYYFNVLESDHNCYRSYISINISMIFAGLSFINSYFTPSLYFFVLYITIAQIDSTRQLCANLATVISGIYCFVILAAIGGSLVGKKWQQNAHVVSAILSAYTFAMMGLVIYNIFQIYLDVNNLNFDSFRTAVVIIMVLVNLGSFFVIVFIHLITHFKFVCKLFMDTISYMSFQGAYSQTMVIYGMCNVDDVSWGTKGATGGSGVSKFFTSKVFFVSSWLFYNCILAYILIYVDIVIPQRNGTQGGIVLLGIGIYATVQIGIKTILATLNFIHWILRYKICGIRTGISKNNINNTQLKWIKLKKQYDQNSQSKNARSF